jgi:hypothetical protein
LHNGYITNITCWLIFFHLHLRILFEPETIMPGSCKKTWYSVFGWGKIPRKNRGLNGTDRLELTSVQDWKKSISGYLPV